MLMRSSEHHEHEKEHTHLETEIVFSCVLTNAPEQPKIFKSLKRVECYSPCPNAFSMFDGMLANRLRVMWCQGLAQGSNFI